MSSDSTVHKTDSSVENHTGVRIAPRQTSLLDQTWIHVKDGNDTGRAIFDNHYSRYRYADGRKPLLYVGPGEKTVLVTPDALGLFAWRKFPEISGNFRRAILRRQRWTEEASDAQSNA